MRKGSFPFQILLFASLRLCVSLFLPSLAQAADKKAGPLKPPEPGYVFPAGGKAGTTVPVVFGGYEWTPDAEIKFFDPRIKIERLGPPGPVLVPPPPFWFGAKSTQTPPPLPREVSAKITLPPDLKPGPIRWATASASGAGVRTGIFWISPHSEIAETPVEDRPQLLPALPVSLSGRLSKLEEVDRYRFTTAKDGPVSCEVFARRLGHNINIALKIIDAQGVVVADAVDTEGRDLAVTFRAKANTEYTLTVHDLDYRGDFSDVYRLVLTAGPRVMATIPACGTRGETRDVEFIGPGISSGGEAVESVVRKVAFPADAKLDALRYTLETPHGNADYELPLSDRVESVAAPGSELALPSAATGVFDGPANEHKFRVIGKKGDTWEILAEARRFGSSVDVSVGIFGPDGKELARADDLPGTTDVSLPFVLPADGAFTISVSDLSGRPASRGNVYRFTVEKPAPDYVLTTTPKLNVPTGGNAELVVTATRKGGFKGAITLAVAGLPEGLTVPPNLIIPVGAPSYNIPIDAAANAPSDAAFITVTGSAECGSRPALAPLPGDLSGGSQEQTSSILLAVTLKSRILLAAVEADGGRKVYRGSTHPAEVTIDRFEGFTGEVLLWMASQQGYQRQGINGPEMAVPPGDGRAFYPCFMPEWLETTRTSRMVIVGVVKVPDGRGRERYLVSQIAGRITMSIEGAILKVTADPGVPKLAPRATAVFPVNILRSAVLEGPVKLELVAPPELAGRLTAAPVEVAAGTPSVSFKISRSTDAMPGGEQAVIIRATALREGKWRVMSEATVKVESVAK